MRGATIDIETYPGVHRSYADNLYEAALIKEEKPVRLASFSVKELGRHKPYTVGEWQFDTYEDFVKELWMVFNEYDFLIGQNIKAFDDKQSNTFFAEVGLPKPSCRVFIDTMLIARANFKLPSYSLKYLVKYFGIGSKIETGGSGLWFAVEEGNEKARRDFLKYNENDTIVTEKLCLYFKELGYIKNWPGSNHFTKAHGCPQCHAPRSRWQCRGIKGYKEGRAQTYSCNDCGKRGRDENLVEPWSHLVFPQRQLAASA